LSSLHECVNCRRAEWTGHNPAAVFADIETREWIFRLWPSSVAGGIRVRRVALSRAVIRASSAQLRSSVQLTDNTRQGVRELGGVVGARALLMRAVTVEETQPAAASSEHPVLPLRGIEIHLGDGVRPSTLTWVLVLGYTGAVDSMRRRVIRGTACTESSVSMSP
jgi:hypothetical protein